MAEILNSKILVKHIANGTLGELCLVCLSPLEENSFESIFTTICKADSEFRVADALTELCHFQLQEAENFNVCTSCFISATKAYKFSLQAKRSMELIMHYTQELLSNVNHVEIAHEDMDKLLLIPLTECNPSTTIINFSLDGIGNMKNIQDDDGSEISDKTIKNDENKDDDNILVVVENQSEYESKSQSSDEDDELLMIINEKKVRKKRDPMMFMNCSRCPVKYRFVAKLKDHMKTEHGVELYYCKICKILTEQKLEYLEHLKKHAHEHQCPVCNTVYKKADTLAAHMKLHEKQDFEVDKIENANMCEICGAIFEDEASLEDHMRSRHLKRHTCYYCGRLYRSEGSFEAHLLKHEQYWNKRKGSKPTQINKQADKETDKPAGQQDKSKRSVCHTCGKDFVDERSLLWHQRLHSNDRPYKCQECGRGFVSLNRRNQHALCAHTPPQRRCPLCPALFHLRSMVNTHVKKVHLKAHKRRNRTSKHQNVFWKTQAVPIQELSIDVQNDVLELQAAQGSEVALDEG